MGHVIVTLYIFSFVFVSFYLLYSLIIHPDHSFPSSSSSPLSAPPLAASSSAVSSSSCSSTSERRGAGPLSRSSGGG